jgi:hypothetical protein
MNPSNPSSTQTNPSGETVTESSPGGIASAKQNIKATAREAVDQVRSAAASTVARAKEESGRIAGEKKYAAADRIGGYSSAIHDSAKSLEEKDPNIAWFTHRAADRLQEAADYVRDHDIGELRRDAEEVARRHPAVFFGGLFVVGLLVGNLLKASGRAAGNGRESGDSIGTGREGVGIPENIPGAAGPAQATQNRLDPGGTAEPRGFGIENPATT